MSTTSGKHYESNIPEELRRQLKARAALEKRRIPDVITSAVRHYLTLPISLEPGRLDELVAQGIGQKRKHAA